jgi:hypothetical protein
MPEDKKHFDVAQPGQLPVSHTSRPVIVGQQATPVGDPMMRVHESEQARPVADHKVSLQPIHPDTKSEVESDSKTDSPDPVEGEAVSSEPDVVESPKPDLLTPNENPEIQKLIVEKTYRLPIKTPARKTITVAAVVAVVVALVIILAAYSMMNR